jgi:hypothetical protein
MRDGTAPHNRVTEFQNNGAGKGVKLEHSHLVSVLFLKTASHQTKSPNAIDFEHLLY